MNELLVADTETTGFYKPKSWVLDPAQPHLVQLSALVVDIDVPRVMQSINLIVCPVGWDIPEHLTENVHGISTEYATSVGLPEKQVLDAFLQLWSGPAEQPLTCIFHNAPFDRGIIATSIARTYGEGTLLKAWLDGSTFCTMEASKSLEIGGTRHAPSLVKTYKHLFGHELERAHSANADTVATLEIFLELRKRGLANV